MKLSYCLNDAGVGRRLILLVLYNEGASSEADFSGELSLLAIVQGITVSDLTHDNFYG